MMAKNGLADVLTYMENQPSYAHRLPESKDYFSINMFPVKNLRFVHTLNHTSDKYDGFCYYTCMCVDKYVIVQMITQVDNVQSMIQYEHLSFIIGGGA